VTAGFSVQLLQDAGRRLSQFDFRIGNQRLIPPQEVPSAHAREILRHLHYVFSDDDRVAQRLPLSGEYPRRFLPICFFETMYHLLGICEGWYILAKLMSLMPDLQTSFLLESVSRIITIVFKLIPFVIGVDEAGAQFVTETLAIGASIGVTLAVIRKGRILFWTAVGLVLIVKRGLSFRDIRNLQQKQN